MTLFLCNHTNQSETLAWPPVGKTVAKRRTVQSYLSYKTQINRAVIQRVEGGLLRGCECVLSIWDGVCVTPDGGDGDEHDEIMIARAALGWRRRGRAGG